MVIVLVLGPRRPRPQTGFRYGHFLEFSPFYPVPVRSLYGGLRYVEVCHPLTFGAAMHTSMGNETIQTLLIP